MYVHQIFFRRGNLRSIYIWGEKKVRHSTQDVQRAQKGKSIQERNTKNVCALKIIIYDYKTYECAKRKLEAEHKYDLSI